MGSSIGVARGASMAGVKYAFAVIGDSTFFHSGLTGIVDAVSANSSVVICILDNSIVAMTGCQETILPSQSIINAVEGLGVKKEHIRILTPLPAHLEENEKVLLEEAEFSGPSVVIFQRECLEALRKARK
jgi:indolepyruvate ferredoxin oxidoreductase alpha subunit